MLSFPGANQEQMRAFKEYIERQVATNRDFMERLLRARDFQDAFRIQVKFFFSPMEGCRRGCESDWRKPSGRTAAPWPSGRSGAVKISDQPAALPRRSR